MLQRWVHHGELDDPFEEFFILQKQDAKDEDFWEHKYDTRDDMVPGFLNMALAKKVVVVLSRPPLLCGFHTSTDDVRL